MPLKTDPETVLYHQKLVHKAWLSKVVLRHVKPSDEATELVWELLLAYGEALRDFDAASEDIYKIAHELVTLALAGNMPIETAFKIYRDYLVEAIMSHLGDGSVRALVGFANLVSSAFCEANSDLLKKTIRHRRAESLSNEMKLAKQIQSHLLPKTIPQIPGFDFAGRLVPATEIGGDYWSIKYHSDPDIVTMKLADITGHGIAAATLVAAVKFISGGYFHASKSAAEVMTKTNHVLTLETPHDILVSMIYGWLRPATYELTLVNAGHSPAFICREDSCVDISPTGPLLGVDESATYGEQTVNLAKGDLVFFGSDGITEAGIGKPFGMARLKKLVLENSHQTADEIADKVIETVTDYAQQAQDDISLLVLKITGDPPGNG